MIEKNNGNNVMSHHILKIHVLASDKWRTEKCNELYASIHVGWTFLFIWLSISSISVGFF